MSSPATFEGDIAAFGIHTSAQLNAALSRPVRGSVLLDAVLDSITGYGGVVCDGDEPAALVRLLAEPELNASHLDVIAKLISWRASRPRFAGVTVAVCTHPRTAASTVVDVLWSAPVSVARDVGLAAGALLAPAVSWVRRELSAWARADRLDGELRFTPDGVQRELVAAVFERWARLSEGSPDLVSFLLASSYDFTCEETMLAAGRAIAGPPVRSHPLHP